VVADDPGVVFQMIEQVDHQRAVCSQTDVGSLINVADVDQDRVLILPAPAPDLGCAARKATQICIPSIIGRGQNVSVQVGCVNDGDPDSVFVQRDRGSRDRRRGAKQTGLPDCFEKAAPSGGTQLDRHTGTRQD